MSIPSTCFKLFGLASIAVALIAAAAIPFGYYPQHKSLDGYLFALGLMTLVSAGMVIAARLVRTQDPLAEKVVPSCIVAYFLFIVMTSHWLAN